MAAHECGQEYLSTGLHVRPLARQALFETDSSSVIFVDPEHLYVRFR